MGPLSLFNKIYDVDTLDTRLTTGSNVPYQTVIDSRNDPDVIKETADKAKLRSQPSKWRSPEFVLYSVAMVFIIPAMLWMAYSVSRESDPRYHKFSKWLWPGWVPGRRIDLSDAQYYTFRLNLPYMGSLLLFHPLLRKLWNSFYKPSGMRGGDGANRLEQRASFDATFAIVFLFALYGFSAVKILTIMYLNYQIATKLPKRNVPAATWLFNIGTLFGNELLSGYRLQVLFGYIAEPNSSLVQWGQWIEDFSGILGRWEVLFNITTLRLISFNLDYYWSADKRNGTSLEKKQLDPANLSERDRVSIPADMRDFSLRNYIAYAIYAPLYLAGPIMTFNDYIAQAKYRAATIENKRTVLYGIRWLLALLALELVLHFNYVGAIARSGPVWMDYTAAQLGMLSFLNLHIIWLKLLLPWRLFRLWALIDGMDPPENIVRCVNNNYSTQMFWRSWHRSYNKWLIRYIYIPLGGTSFRDWVSSLKSAFTFLLIFTFVALWHDIKLRLLIWGWMIVLFMVPEWTATWLFPARKWESRPTEYRMLCCVGGVLSVFMMVSANLVGFAIGVDGLQSIIRSVLHDFSGFIFINLSGICLFMMIQVMFEVREGEKRRGFNLKC